MGYYIQCSAPTGKAREIIEKLDGIEISAAEAEMIIREDIGGAVICVVDNGLFEAAAYCHSLREFQDFTRPDDDRPKTWLLVNDEARVQQLTGYGQ